MISGIQLLGTNIKLGMPNTPQEAIIVLAQAVEELRFFFDSRARIGQTRFGPELVRSPRDEFLYTQCVFALETLEDAQTILAEQSDPQGEF